MNILMNYVERLNKMNKKFKQISNYFKQFPNFEIKTEEHFLFVNYNLSKNLTIYMVIEDDSDEAYFYSYNEKNSLSALMKLCYRVSHLNERVYYNEYDEDYVKELKDEFNNIIKDVYDELSKIYNKLIPEFINEYKQMRGENNA